MSTPWCERPPERGAPQVLAYATAPCTGHTMPGAGGGGGAGGSGVGAGAGGWSPPLSDPPPDATFPLSPPPASLGASAPAPPSPAFDPLSGLTTPCGCCGCCAAF